MLYIIIYDCSSCCFMPSFHLLHLYAGVVIKYYKIKLSTMDCFCYCAQQYSFITTFKNCIHRPIYSVFCGLFEACEITEDLRASSSVAATSPLRLVGLWSQDIL